MGCAGAGGVERNKGKRMAATGKGESAISSPANRDALDAVARIKGFLFFLENSPTVHWQEVGCRHLSPCHDHMLSQGTKIKEKTFTSGDAKNSICSLQNQLQAAKETDSETECLLVCSSCLSLTLSLSVIIIIITFLGENCYKWMM